MQWIDEAGLSAWAKRLDARAYLPDMIADLIRASITDASRFRFFGGDAAQLRGWDGNLETAEEAKFVPAGKSKWEFGSGAVPQRHFPTTRNARKRPTLRR